MCWEKEFLANIFGLFANYSHVGYLFFFFFFLRLLRTTGFEFKIDCHCVLTNPKVII